LFDNDPHRGQNIGPLGIKIPISRQPVPRSPSLVLLVLFPRSPRSLPSFSPPHLLAEDRRRRRMHKLPKTDPISSKLEGSGTADAPNANSPICVKSEDP